MSDGGDGFGEIVGTLLQAEKRIYPTVNAAHESIDAAWWWSEASSTAIVESANVIGLAMLPLGRFHPFELDTLGLGQLLLHISQKHPGARLVIGIGGSATNDAGFGFARGLGFRFLDLNEYCLDRWINLDRLLKIEVPHIAAAFSQVTIACDVQNPLLGPNGASRIYGPQKGLRVEDFPLAEKCFERLVKVVSTDLQMDCSEEPGTGAAGGLGYGLRVFLNGKFEPGFSIFSRLAQLPSKVAATDLIVTAEGAIDAQTEMGKGTGAIASLAREHQKRCIGLAGYLPQKENRAFDLALGIAPELTSVEEAKRNPAHWLQKLSALAAARLALLLAVVVSMGCLSTETPKANALPEARAVQFLAREVPAWARENRCYSCHNNGDGARALFVAASKGHSIGDSTADTISWLLKPDTWEQNKGDPAASDQRLADLQFAFALFTGIEAGLVKDQTVLTRASRRLLPQQAADGAWHVEPQDGIGSPVTYGTTLATYIGWKILSATDGLTLERDKAAGWLRGAELKNIPAAAALLLFALDSRNKELQTRASAYLVKHQLPNGGWGPYPLAPAENFDTAVALLALGRAEARPEILRRGRNFLLTQQNSDASWAATTRPTGGESYAQQISTTAWVTLALLAAE
jgi:glycerate kinase